MTKLSWEDESSLLAASSNKENKSQILETLTCMTPEASTLNHAGKILWALGMKLDRDRKKLLFLVMQKSLRVWFLRMQKLCETDVFHPLLNTSHSRSTMRERREEK